MLSRERVGDMYLVHGGDMKALSAWQRRGPSRTVSQRRCGSGSVLGLASIARRVPPQ
jgi:hypothetical protein